MLSILLKFWRPFFCYVLSLSLSLNKDSIPTRVLDRLWDIVKMSKDVQHPGKTQAWLAGGGGIYKNLQ